MFASVWISHGPGGNAGFQAQLANVRSRFGVSSQCFRSAGLQRVGVQRCSFGLEWF